MRVKLDGYECERCGHQWFPREPNETPRVCPKCKSPYWDRPRKIEGKADKLTFQEKRKLK